MRTDHIELNDKFREALRVIEGGAHVFLTGRAGTGKSTFLEYVRTTMKRRMAILAPTGVAALNVRGQTIHSFFGFKPDITISKARIAARSFFIDRELFLRIETLVIDEISMVRADLLDCIDTFLQTVRNAQGVPFGGVQMVFIGDLYQLPPVVTPRDREIFTTHYESPYFFSSNVYKEFSMAFVELEKIYRQKDEGFIKLLNGVRNRTITGAELAQLNIRLDHAFQPPQHELWIALTPTNAAAQTINAARLANLKEKEFSYEASSNGGFDRTQVPVDGSLALKKGAQVMMANNDREGRWVNGTIGRIEKIKKGRNGMPDAIFVKFADSSLGTVMPHTWELFEYQYNDEKKDLDTKITGSFTQYPLRLAWAVTIHKSQGKTFDRVIIDMDRGAFAHGQTYVALSRCRTLEGIVLKRPIMKHHILVDSRVSDFVSRFA